jgi:formamidopyrimidine-DNA glycosylase
MPELPEVETMAVDLRGHLLGASISDAWGTRPGMLAIPLAQLREEVAGARILAVQRRAKTVLLRLDSGRILTFAPRMTGLFVIGPAGSPRQAHDRFGLTLADGRELRFRDLRTFGRIGIYATDAAGEPLKENGQLLFAGIGPEPLGPDFTLECFVERLGSPRWAQKRLKPLLLDQSFLAGLGNIYADEVLWQTRLHPLRLANSLHTAEIISLYMTIRATLAEAVAQRGSAVSDYRPPNGGAGMQEHLAAYGRAGRPCHRCGVALVRIVVAGRGTCFCPACQVLPIAVAAREASTADPEALA